MFSWKKFAALAALVSFAGIGQACVVTTGTCFVDGTACDFDIDCCSGFCAADGFCGVGSCVVDDGACAFDSDCCTDFCASDGFCGCIPDDSACGAIGADCCSGFCDVDGFCGPGGSCLADLSACVSDAECCTGVCNFADDLCGCAFDAEPCVDDTDCCTGFCDIDGLCTG